MVFDDFPMALFHPWLGVKGGLRREVVTERAGRVGAKNFSSVNLGKLQPQHSLIKLLMILSTWNLHIYMSNSYIYFSIMPQCLTIRK